MTDGITAAGQQGVISTQLQQTQTIVVPPTPPSPETPPDQPIDSSRGENVDTSA